MGGHSSGGEDRQVSGAEAVASKGKLKTYSSMNIDPKKGKTVNEQIAEQNRINRQSRKGFFKRYIENMPLGKLSKSKWSKERNLKSRKAWMKKNPDKFKDMSKYSDEFIGSEGFKTQIDALGYADRNRVIGERDYEPLLKKTSTKSTEQPKVDSQMDNSDVKSDMIVATGPTSSEIDDETIGTKIKRKGRKQTILTSVTGDNEKATLGKKTLLSY